MKKKTTTIKLLVFAFLYSLLLFAPKAYSQDNIKTDILDPIWVVPDTIIPIEITDIINSAEATLEISSEIDKSLPDSAELSSFNIRMEELITSIDSVSLVLKDYDLEDIGSGLVRNYKSLLTHQLTVLERLKNELNKGTKKTQEQWIKIDYLVRTWELTISSNKGESFTETLQKRSENILATITAQRDIIAGLSDELLMMDDKLLTAKQELEKDIDLLRMAEEMFQLKYLTKTHPATWELDTILYPSPVIIFHATMNAYGDGLPNFYAIYKIRIFFHLGIFLIFLLVSFTIKGNLKKRNIASEDESIANFIKVFKRPISVSLTLTIFLGMLLYPDAPIVIRDILSFAIIIPLLFVAVQVMPKSIHKYLYVISGLFFFEELMDTVKYVSFLLPGLLILFVLLATFAYILWLIISRYIKYKGTVRRKIKWMDAFLWLALLIILVSIITNMLGYVNLSFFLFNSTLISLMAGLLISTCVIILDGFFNLIIMGNSSHQYGMVSDYGKMLVSRILQVIKLIAIIYWIGIVLRLFLISSAVTNWLSDIVESKWVINELTISLKGILFFGLVIFLSIWISRFIRLLLDKEVFPRMKFGRGVPGMISLIIRVVIVTIGFILSLAVLGIPFDRLTLLLGALGVGIGFGLQDIINNLISGFILVFERPIHVGDVVQFGEREGKIKEIGIRASVIKTYDGSEVIVPNGILISQELTNLTLSDPILRIEVNVGTEYGSDPQEVIDILVMQAKSHPDVTKFPETFGIFLGFGDFSLNFRLYAYTLEVNSRLRIRSELNLAIYEALKEANIRIPFPIQDINVNLTEKKDTKK